jgi:hypothetical protein
MVRWAVDEKDTRISFRSGNWIRFLEQDLGKEGSAENTTSSCLTRHIESLPWLEQVHLQPMNVPSLPRSANGHENGRSDAMAIPMSEWKKI